MGTALALDSNKAKTLLFWIGLAIYVISFGLVAIVDYGRPVTGYGCAAWSISAAHEIVRHFRNGYGTLPSAVESISITLTALINVFFVLYAAASPFWVRKRLIMILRIAVLSTIPFCWIVSYYESFHLREGHLLWILGMLLVLFSGFNVKEAKLATD